MVRLLGDGEIAVRVGGIDHVMTVYEADQLIREIRDAQSEQGRLWRIGLDSGTHVLDRDMKVVRL